MSSGNSTGERDPFAPPPADAPDRPWQPRTPPPPAGGGTGADGPGGSEGGRPGEGGDRPDGPPGRPPVPPPHPWSPGWQGRPGGPYPSGGPQQRYDPTDPVQRRARYALLCGMWGMFFMLFDIPYLGLLLGALAVYWGVSALRGTPRDAAAAAAGTGPDGAAPGAAAPGPAAPPPAGQQPAPLPPPGWAAVRPPRPQVPAAVGGLVTGGVALALVASSWAVHLVYKDYYDCMADALTHRAEQSCSTLAPAWVHGARP
ncbi:hypothetical protein [Streptomyces sp. NPDC001380]|uniref:hypothetical protein n=1 Tax=Streptomyces sp. NPDC001380 TaxID=3364566 RepID=UPI0036A30F03